MKPAVWRRRLKPVLAELTGYARMPGPKDRPPLQVRTLWTRRDFRGLGQVGKIMFTAEVGADVPAYVCLPAHVPPPYRWVICMQGHSTGMHNSIAVDIQTERQVWPVAGDRDFGLGCMRRGLAALCIEQRSFGERAEQAQAKRFPGCHDAVMHALMLGRTLLAERVFDVDRALDYLATRDDVLPGVGVMGQSGGGTVSIYAGALLDRIAFMMPSCSFCTFRDSIMSIGHCADNYVPNLLRYAEAADVLGLFAPKPVVVVAGRQDDLFPLAGVRRAFADVRRIYRAAGAADRCELVIGAEGHRFYANEAWPRMLRMLARAGMPGGNPTAVR